MRRGRPRHDDILTPREWQVLDLLREGLTNDQIAANLGISRDTAKFHVSEILSKLGVENREEAAAWSGRPKAAFALGPLAAVWGKLGGLSPLQIAGAGVIGAAGVSLTLLAAGVLVSSNDPIDQSEPVETVAIEWIEEELPEPVSWEAPRPFRDDIAPGVEDVWRAYLVRDGGEPELIAETHRQLIGNATWSDEEIVFRYVSRKQSSSGALGTPIFGMVAYRPGDPEPQWERVTDEFQASMTADGSAMLFTPRYHELYYAEIGGDSMRMDGIIVETFSIYTAPAGDYFYVSGRENELAGQGSGFVYVTRPGDSTALELDTLTGDIQVFPRWSPDGARLVYPQGDDIVVVDVGAERLTRFTVSVPVPIAAFADWSTDGAFITSAGGLYDAETGDVIVASRFDAVELLGLADASGRFFAINISATDAGAICPTLSDRGVWNGGAATAVYDIASPDDPVCCQSGEYPVYCQSGESSYLHWLTDDHLLLYYECEVECPPDPFFDPPRAEWVLVDLTDPDALSVSSGGSPSLTVGPSPDGRFYVGNDRVEILDPREMDSFDAQLPEGETFLNASFSPDGSEFVFITGPEADFARYWGP